MSFGAALAGLGQGFGQGIKDAQGLEGQYEAGKEQAYNTAAGTSLQLLQALMMHPPQPPQMGGGGMPQAGTSPMPQGSSSMGGQAQQGSGMAMGMGPTVGSPSSFASRFPVADPSGNRIDTEPAIQAPDPSRAGAYSALYATMPGGQPPQGPGMGAMAQVQPQGGGQQPQQQGFGQQQGGQQGGPLTWQTIIQAVQRANPGAPPDVLFGAVNKMVPLMNSQSLMEWRQIQGQYKGIAVDQKQQTIDQRGGLYDSIIERNKKLYGSGSGDFYRDRAAATATGRTDALTQPMEGGGGASRQSAMTTERTFASGPEARAVRAFNVVTQHLGVLREAADALQNGNVQKLNKLGQTFAENLGSPVPTNFDAVKTIVTNEMNKAIIGGAGAVFDRAEIQSTISKANSPQQIVGVIDNYIKLAAGQLSGLQKQYESGTGKKDFDQRFISQATKQLMGGNLGDASKSVTTTRVIDREAARKAGYTDKEIDAFEKGQ